MKKDSSKNYTTAQGELGETVPSNQFSGEKRQKRPKKRDTSLARQSSDPAWQMLDKRIGGRTGLLGVALASANPKAAILAELLLDPAFNRAGTKALAKKAGMSVPEIVDLFRDKKLLETMLILHEGLPKVVEGAVDDAAPSMVPCSECKGTGVAENGDSCWICRGVGEVRKAGDKDKLGFIGKAAGMIDKGGPLVQTNIQVNAQSGGGDTFESLMRRATIKVEHKQVEGQTDVIDIE